MNERLYMPIGGIRHVDDFKAHLKDLGMFIPCDSDLRSGEDSVFAQSLALGDRIVGNRFCIHPMEGWDGTVEGQPTEHTLRRWRHFGMSGAKLIWGGEAVAVCHDGRANPNQLLINRETKAGLERLRDTLLRSHHEVAGRTSDLLLGLQLTHSGRYSSPNRQFRHEPRILYHHPILDARVNIDQSYAVLSDSEIQKIIANFHDAARIAWEVGFDFVDIKHCHGYLGHEFLSAHTRDGDYGGCFENRTRFLREIVEGIRCEAPGLQIAVRVSAFDTVPFRPRNMSSEPTRPGIGIPEDYSQLRPYRWGFGVNVDRPEEYDLSEAKQFLALLCKLGIKLVNISGGSPYYNPHIQRPALYPPSDGYLPPEDPLAGVARQIQITRTLKDSFPDLLFVGSGYSYLQQFLPYVAQATLREGWVDAVGLGRMVLAYPQMPFDVLGGRPLRQKSICRTFSDCTTAPRNGLPSGCYPLDDYYKRSQSGNQLKAIKTLDRQRKRSTG